MNDKVNIRQNKITTAKGDMKITLVNADVGLDTEDCQKSDCATPPLSPCVEKETTASSDDG